jgi:hypothetical protein
MPRFGRNSNVKSFVDERKSRPLGIQFAFIEVGVIIMSNTNQDQNHEAANAINSDENSNAVKDPHDWATGDEPMTGAQKSYLKTLSDQAGEPFDEGLTKAEASLKIDELQNKTGRGKE